MQEYNLVLHLGLLLVFYLYQVIIRVRVPCGRTHSWPGTLPNDKANTVLSSDHQRFKIQTRLSLHGIKHLEAFSKPEISHKIAKKCDKNLTTQPTSRFPLTYLTIFNTTNPYTAVYQHYNHKTLKACKLPSQRLKTSQCTHGAVRPQACTKSPSLIAPGFMGISTDAFFAGQAGRQADR